MNPALAAVAMLLAAACAAPGRYVAYASVRPLETAGDLVSLTDYGRDGERAARRALTRLQASGGPSPAQLAAWRRTCVRIRAHGADDTMVIGSGVLVDGGRCVVTAEHVLLQAAYSGIDVVLVDGRTFAAMPEPAKPSPASDAAADWALLRLQSPPATPLPHAAFGAAAAGAHAFLLGYPDHLGVDAEGVVAHGLELPDDAWLEPLTLVTRVVSDSPLRLLPLAGALPLGGASGGGVFDARGRLLGVLSRLQERSAPAGCSYLLLAATPPPVQ